MPYYFFNKSVLIPQINPNTEIIRLDLNKLNPTKYVIWDTELYMYISNIKTDMMQMQKETLNIFFITLRIDLSIFVILEIKFWTIKRPPLKQN